MAQRRKRVAIISRGPQTTGGASKCGDLLAKALPLVDIEATLFTFESLAKPQQAYHSPVVKGLSQRAFLKLRKAERSIIGTEFLPLERQALLRRLSDFDIAHFYDTWWTTSPKTVSSCAKGIPTALTLQDCHEFTGGCMYPSECDRFQTNCGNCPQKESIFRFGDFSRFSLDVRRSAYADREISLLAPSRWIAGLCANSAIFGRHPRVIPNAIDTSIFKPISKPQARQKFDLQPEGLYVLISAHDLKDRRKGIDLAIDAVNRYAEQAQETSPSFKVLLMGKDPEAIAGQLQIPARSIGFLSNDYDIANAYAAADVFLFPSRTDNYPLAVLESLACGTPVVALRRAGIAEMFVDQREGIYLEEESPELLASELERLLKDEEPLRDMGFRSAKRMAEQHSLLRYAEQHRSAYEEMLDAKTTKS